MNTESESKKLANDNKEILLNEEVAISKEVEKTKEEVITKEEKAGMINVLEMLSNSVKDLVSKVNGIDEAKVKKELVFEENPSNQKGSFRGFVMKGEKAEKLMKIFDSEGFLRKEYGLSYFLVSCPKQPEETSESNHWIYVTLKDAKNAKIGSYGFKLGGDEWTPSKSCIWTQPKSIVNNTLPLELSCALLDTLKKPQEKMEYIPIHNFISTSVSGKIVPQSLLTKQRKKAEDWDDIIEMYHDLDNYLGFLSSASKKMNSSLRNLTEEIETMKEIIAKKPKN